MSTSSAAELLIKRARESASSGKWEEAYVLLVEAEAQSELDTQDLPLFADVSYAAGHIDVTLTVWERAYGLNVRRGEKLAAAGAAVKVALHLLFDTALMAPVRGWTTRAERLLEGLDETPVHAWLAVARNYERLLSGDFSGAREWSRKAIDIGTRLEPGAAAVGRVAEARAMILEGEVSQGLALLNEAAVAAVSGELDPLLTGVVYCELVCAAQALGQYDLAREWTEAMERWHQDQPVGSIHGRCRVHRAEILRLQGTWQEAEEEALLACEELRPYLRREFGWPLTELGRIRLRKGDVSGAEEAFLAAHEAGWDPQPGLALVHLALGETKMASVSIRDAIQQPRYVPSKEAPPHSELWRAPLLEAQVEIEIAAGDLETARTAAAELAQIAARFDSKALKASACSALGQLRLAEGRGPDARREFEAAAQLWMEIGAPYETALARLGAGRAWRIEGNETLSLLEFKAARSGFEQVGARREAALAAEAGGDAPQGPLKERHEHAGSRAETGADNVFRREGDFWTIIFDGRTAHLRDVKGLHYLARLLGEPGREFHVLDLIAAERDDASSANIVPEGDLPVRRLSDAGELLDPQAKEQYRRRLVEIEDDIEEARAMGDTERAVQAKIEREFLIRELTRAVGLGGRDRRAGSTSERARVSVTRSVRQAMSRIGDHHPELAKHLERAIRTGVYCAYLPDLRLPADWNV